jgi:hypothetical protein
MGIYHFFIHYPKITYFGNVRGPQCTYNLTNFSAKKRIAKPTFRRIIAALLILDYLAGRFFSIIYRFRPINSNRHEVQRLTECNDLYIFYYWLAEGFFINFAQ